jgi:glutathione S-transferase
MSPPIVYGPTYSAYVRTVRLVLAEKNLPYELVEVDILKGEHQAPEHRARHPFAKVPAFEHDGTALYETSAITRYLDAAFPSVPLTPTEPAQIGRMQQAIAVYDAYAYPALISTLFIQQVVTPMMGGTADEAAIAATMPTVERCLRAFDQMLEGQVWLSGGDLGLADLHLAPGIAYFAITPEGRKLLPAHANLQRWWAAMAPRGTMAATEPKLG